MFDRMRRSWSIFLHPEENVLPYRPITFDPLLGFGNRKERVVKVTEKELRACKIPKDKWDYCADKLFEAERCRIDNIPFLWRCKSEFHDASVCSLDDYILRMKEYERERRLLEKQLRLKK